MSRERGNTGLRSVDRYIGIPLIQLLGTVHRRHSLPTEVSDIGVLMFGAIGDSLLAGSTLPSIKAAYPAARLTLFLSQSNRGALDLLKGYDRSVVLPLGNPLRALLDLRRHRLDLLVDFSPWPRVSALLAALARTRHSAGFKTSGQSRHHAFDTVAEHRMDRHEIENIQALARAVGADPSGWPRLDMPPDLRAHVAGTVPTPFVVLHPFASGFKAEQREWPTDRWLQVVAALHAVGTTSVITGGPADAPRAEALATASCGAAISVAGRLSLAETTALLQEASAVVSVNTGVMHMAAAVDAPLIALHGPTNPLRWGPLSRNAVVLGGDGPDCGFLNLGFEYPDDTPDCMARISVASVIEALGSLQGRHQTADATPREPVTSPA